VEEYQQRQVAGDVSRTKARAKATGEKNPARATIGEWGYQSGRLDLNQRPPAPEAETRSFMTMFDDA
jgi:hypothetical protein